MTRLFQIILFGFMMLVLPVSTAFAMDVATAKSQGLVGERPDGLLGIVTPPGSAEVRKLVSDTNAGRMDIYISMSSRQKVPLPQIQSIAAENLIARALKGHYVFTNGAWVQK